MSYSLTLFQLLATAAGYDPHLGPGSTCTTDCVIPFAGGTKSVTSVVLIANGIAFGVGPPSLYQSFEYILFSPLPLFFYGIHLLCRS
jgi:hypothetical protein